MRFHGARSARFFKNFDFLAPQISKFRSPAGASGDDWPSLGSQLSNTWKNSWFWITSDLILGSRTLTYWKNSVDCTSLARGGCEGSEGARGCDGTTLAPRLHPLLPSHPCGRTPPRTPLAPGGGASRRPLKRIYGDFLVCSSQIGQRFLAGPSPGRHTVQAWLAMNALALATIFLLI